jgi:hypothetical protein
MALVSRSVRPGSAGRRWVVTGIVVALFVLLIDASLHSRSSGPDKQLATGAWVDRVLPLVATSTEEGQQLAAVWTNGLQMPVTSVSNQLDQVAAGATSAYRQASALRPPDDLVGPGGLLAASLLSRSDAAVAVRDALDPVVLGKQPAGAAALAAIAAAGQDLQVGDQAYRLFLQSMPNVGVALPSSLWDANPAPYQPAAAQLFLASLQSATSATPVHQVRIDSIATSPNVVSLQGNVHILPDSASMSVTVVLSDTGNQPENNLAVTAAITPGGGATLARAIVSLVPGQAQTLQNLGPLDPRQGVDVTLTVTITPPAGSPTPPVSQPLILLMPASPPSATTSIPAAPPTT